MEKKPVLDYSKPTSEQIRDEMLNFMNLKYDKTFIGLSLEQRGIDRSSDKLVCYAEGDNRDKDFAYVYRDISDGVIEYSDTYFAILIREELNDEIENICRNFGFESKVYSDTLTCLYANEYDKSKTLADLKSDKSQPGFLVEVALTTTGIDLNEEISQEIFNAFREANLLGDFTLYSFTRPIFDTVTDANVGVMLTPANDNVITYYFRSVD